MKHIDLFSGIGGFSLAVDTVWYEQKNHHTFVEWEAFPQAVLRKHWPEAEIHGDIRQFVADARSKKPNRISTGWSNGKKVPAVGQCDILTGGFPCQPFSHAGLRKGTADDRYLWPPMLECIALYRPRWVIAENVAGLASWNDGLVLQTVCSDLEKEGYEAQPFIIPACAVGAPHRRDRVWIVAHAESERGGGKSGEIRGAQRRPNDEGVSEREYADSDAPDSTSARGQQQYERQAEGQRAGRDRESGSQGSNWTENWPEAATRLCSMDDGLPRGLVRPRGWRNAALKAAGNAIVPQVAIEIMTAMKNVDNCA